MGFRGNTLSTLPLVVEPTLQDRLNGAQAIAGQARSSFLIAAVDLENSARELDFVATETETEIDRLIELRDLAEYEATANRIAAKRLRDLVEEPSVDTLFDF